MLPTMLMMTMLLRLTMRLLNLLLPQRWKLKLTLTLRQ
jgi:hypothetical protein